MTDHVAITRTDGVLDMGQSTLYPLLYNLEAQALVKTEWRDAESGRRRKYYSLTAQGRRQLRDEVASWKHYVAVVTNVLEPG